MPQNVHQEMLEKLGPEDQKVVCWLYEVTKTPEVGVMLWGYAEAVAVQNQDWTFFAVLREMYRRVSVMKMRQGGPIN